MILPFREAFSAIFFVSLGLLINIASIVRDPVISFIGIALVIAIKSVAALIAFRSTGLSWQRAFGPSLALSHVGEFAFVLILLAATSGVITKEQREQVLGVAGGTLLVSPMLIRYGFRRRDEGEDAEQEQLPFQLTHTDDIRHLAVVVGMGPVGRAVARD